MHTNPTANPVFLGELAALGCSLMFSVGPVLFTLAGRNVGSAVVNRIRLLLALAILAVIHGLRYGALVPLDAGGERWLWFGLSGIVGLALGDAALFEAFVRLGPRLTMLLFSLSPVLSALFAWQFLAETLTPTQLAGVGLTTGGVLWVVHERDATAAAVAPRRSFDVGLALLAAAGQAGGLVLAKRGFADPYPALSGQVIRMLAAVVAIWAWTVARRQVKPTLDHLRAHPTARRFIVAGTLTGPVTGVFLSLVAVAHSPVGIASTLMSLPPVFLLPLSAVVFHDRPSHRAVLGTGLTVLGVAVLFLAGGK